MPENKRNNWIVIEFEIINPFQKGHILSSLNLVNNMPCSCSGALHCQVISSNDIVSVKYAGPWLSCGCISLNALNQFWEN